MPVVTEKEVVLENQRWFLGLGWRPTKGLLLDPKPWTLLSGEARVREEVELPEESDGIKWHWIDEEFRVDTERPDCDKDGWHYGVDFRRAMSATMKTHTVVRRRHWVRRRQASVPHGWQSPVERNVDAEEAKPSFAGWLEKRGRSKDSGWTRRYFVLTPSEGTLCYFKQAQDKSPRGSIALGDIVSTAASTQVAHSFIIATIQRSWVLVADDVDELNAWLFALGSSDARIAGAKSAAVHSAMSAPSSAESSVPSHVQNDSSPLEEEESEETKLQDKDSESTDPAADLAPPSQGALLTSLQMMSPQQQSQPTAAPLVTQEPPPRLSHRQQVLQRAHESPVSRNKDEVPRIEVTVFGASGLVEDETDVFGTGKSAPPPSPFVRVSLQDGAREEVHNSSKQSPALPRTNAPLWDPLEGRATFTLPLDCGTQEPRELLIQVIDKRRWMPDRPLGQRRFLLPGTASDGKHDTLMDGGQLVFGEFTLNDEQDIPYPHKPRINVQVRCWSLSFCE